MSQKILEHYVKAKPTSSRFFFPSFLKEMSHGMKSGFLTLEEDLARVCWVGADGTGALSVGQFLVGNPSWDFIRIKDLVFWAGWSTPGKCL